MFKRLLILFLVLIAIIICFITIKKDDEMKIVKLKDIDISIKENSLTRTGATIIITDYSSNKNRYNEWYQIDKKINNKCKKLDYNDKWDNLENYYVDENNTIQFEINWEWKYGKLGNGKYRLIKKVNNNYIAVEFTI